MTDETLTFEATLDHARALDAADSLASMIDAFHIPKKADDSNEIYLC